jgi:hypothetical protein
MSEDLKPSPPIFSLPSLPPEPKKFGFSIADKDLKSKIHENKGLIDLSLKKFTEKIYLPEEIKPLAECRYQFEDKNKLPKEDFRFYLHVGLSEAYITHHKEKFKISKVGTGKATFISFLSDFYCKRFQSEKKEDIESSLNKEGVINIILRGRASSLTRNQNSDHIIGSISFVCNEVSCLLLWLGVENNKYFDKTFGNDKEYLNLSFEHNFKIGTLLLICAQHYTFVRFKTWKICAQVHRGVLDGPIRFYIRNFFIKQDESSSTVDKIKNEYHNYLLGDTNLIWMVCAVSISLSSLSWLSPSKKATFDNVGAILTVINSARTNFLLPMNVPNQQLFMNSEGYGKTIRSKVATLDFTTKNIFNSENDLQNVSSLGEISEIQQSEAVNNSKTNQTTIDAITDNLNKQSGNQSTIESNDNLVEFGDSSVLSFFLSTFNENHLYINDNKLSQGDRSNSFFTCMATIMYDDPKQSNRLKFFSIIYFKGSLD